MNVFEMVAIIVVVVSVAGVFGGYFKTKVSAASRPSGPDAETMSRLVALEERVRTLERIATDKRQRLSDEIDGL